MAKNTSQLPVATTLTGAELVPVWQDGEQRQVSRTIFIAGLGGGGGSYVLPIASAGALGGIKVGARLSIDGTGILSADAYALPIASAGTLGGIKVGGGLSIAGDGTLAATYTYTLPMASAGALGGVRVGGGLAIDGSGILSATYVLPVATTSVLGGVKAGLGLTAAGDGTLSSTPAVVTESGTTRTAAIAHTNNYTRFTNAGTKTYTIDASLNYPVGTEFHGRNMGAGNLTLAGAGGMVLNAPAGGTLAVPTNGAFTVKIVGSSEADVFGVTVAL